MFVRPFFLMTLLLSTFSLAKEYELDLIVDNNSKELVFNIQKEATALFSSQDKVSYKIKVCEDNCENYINKQRGIILLKDSKQYPKTKNNSIVSYNFNSTKYEQSKISRTVALAIYELLKENKLTSIYIKNKKILNSNMTNKVNETALDLVTVFNLAKENNLKIKQNLNTIKIDYLNINEAKSSYKPQIDLYSNYTRVDSDRALYSNGVTSQGTLNIGVKLSQLIFSNEVLQNIKIHKLLYQSTQHEVKALNDEIMYKATLLYLNILKAKKTNKIINIKQTFIQQNLEFAKQRVEIGVKDRSDVFRWQSELANVNIDLANTQRTYNTLKIELANLLQIETMFDITEYDVNSKLFKLNNHNAIKYIEDKRVQKSFSNSIVHTHASLKQLGSLSEVKQEELSLNKESRYMPTVAFEGNSKRITSRDGAGKNTARAWDDDEYTAVLNISIPLYEGGAKSSRIEKNQIELVNLKLQYNALKNLIIENVRKNFESLKRSYDKIKFATVSQEASMKNFELIDDKYKNGKENIISLLDAQDAYIISQLNLNISNIEYLSDLSAIYFFSGKIDVLVNEKKKKEIEKNILNIVKGFKNDEM